MLLTLALSCVVRCVTYRIDSLSLGVDDHVAIISGGEGPGRLSEAEPVGHRQQLLPARCPRQVGCCWAGCAVFPGVDEEETVEVLRRLA